MNWLWRLFGRGVETVSDSERAEDLPGFLDSDFEPGVGYGLFEDSALHEEFGGRSVDDFVLDWLDEIDHGRLER